MSEWIDTTLGEVLTLQRGFDLPEAERLQGIFPVIASTGQIGTHQKAMVSGPGVVIGRSGSIGGGQYIQSDFWPLNTTLWVKDFKGNDVRFCYYLLKSMNLTMFNVGSGVPTLNRNHIHPISVSIPSNVHEQRAIAHILGTLDDKIELNRQMNETLEAMARAIFKSWFVDFDPVRAKAEGRDTGLPKEIADLFPDSFEEMELGEVPRGWKISKLSNVCEYIMSGGTPSTQIPAYWDGDIPWLSSGETRNRFITKTEKTITNLGVEKSSTRLARSKSTVIASAGQGHTRGQTSLLLFDSYINQSVVALAADSKQVSDYYLFFNLSDRYEELRQISDSHSSRGSLTTKLLNNLDIIIPSLELVSKFSQFTEAVVGKIQQNLLQSSMLTELRDTLLPRLISGKLRVKEAEKLVGC